MDNLDIIVQFRSYLTPEAQRTIAEQFNLTDPADDPQTPPMTQADRWLLRARERGVLDVAFGRAVQEAA